jgi:hypothetical protein
MTKSSPSLAVCLFLGSEATKQSRLSYDSLRLDWFAAARNDDQASRLLIRSHARALKALPPLIRLRSHCVISKNPAIAVNA